MRVSGCQTHNWTTPFMTQVLATLQYTVTSVENGACKKMHTGAVCYFIQISSYLIQISNGKPFLYDNRLYCDMKIYRVRGCLESRSTACRANWPSFTGTVTERRAHLL